MLQHPAQLQAWRSHMVDLLTLVQGRTTPGNRLYLLVLGYPYGMTTISMYPREK